MRMKLDIEEKELGIDPRLPSINIKKENGGGGFRLYQIQSRFFYLEVSLKSWKQFILSNRRLLSILQQDFKV